MKVVVHFPYTGREVRWTVPAGVSSVRMETWGAAGGVSSRLATYGKKRQVVGYHPAPNQKFTNLPGHDAEVGVSFSAPSGYAAGTRAVAAGEVYHVRVGGNGHQGFSTIMLNSNGSTFTAKARGGAGGYNGGGDGGKGAMVFQNLHNGTTTKMTYTQTAVPNAAKINQFWYDTSTHKVKKCNATYTSGSSNKPAKWDTITDGHPHSVGPSGGGGGGATDIRFNGNLAADRILIAGGSGGAGGPLRQVGAGFSPIYRTPTGPTPPFGPDVITTKIPTGPDKTWASVNTYFSGGLGAAGIGGGSPSAGGNQPLVGGGVASAGTAGGPARTFGATGAEPTWHGGGGQGATGTKGGENGGDSATDGQAYFGGLGADATGGSGGYDDWCAGGGGGGGGLYGGGGGKMGFKGGPTTTWGGGGGGGSCKVASTLSDPLIVGCARPPHAVGNSGTGANGLGGYARFSYHQAPKATWGRDLPAAALFGSTFQLPWTYAPAVKGGSGIGHYQIGTNTSLVATSPTTITTYTADKPTDTSFLTDFVAPAAGVTLLYFVRAVDLDGDVSDWLTRKVTGVATSELTPATITSPADNAQFIDTATVTWTLGTQTPLVAYKLGISGETLVPQPPNDRDPGHTPIAGTAQPVSYDSPWRRGGSRINFAPDPGFKASAQWPAVAPQPAIVTETAHPGVSGSNGRMTWARSNSRTTQVKSLPLDNLTVGRPYRFHVDIASALANDPYPFQIEVYDQNGLLTSYQGSLAGAAQYGYVPVDFIFTPKAQGVYFVLKPSGSIPVPATNALVLYDFEDATIQGFSSGTSSSAQYESGALSLRTTANSTKVITSFLTSGAGQYLAKVQLYQPSGAATPGQMTVTGAGVSSNLPDTADGVTTNAWQELSVPFTWDGTGVVTLTLNGDAGGLWWDDVEVHKATTSAGSFGVVHTGQIHFLKDLMVEIAYEEDETTGTYGAWFSGSYLNGLSGTVAWSGTTNASPSTLTGTDLLTGPVTLLDTKLNKGKLNLRTLALAPGLKGSSGALAQINLKVNPSLPAVPVVALEVNHDIALMKLHIDANDGAATYKTVSFDIFRGDQRIATGLKPDILTRLVDFWDSPGHAATVLYTVRAWDAAGGYTDQIEGTVTIVNNGYSVPFGGAGGLFPEQGNDEGPEDEL